MPLATLLRRIFDPVCFGLDNVPVQGPVMLVGNHSLMGALDPPVIWQVLYERLGVRVRSLGDHMHERIPLWRDMTHDMGVVDGTPENCARLIEQGAHIMVFPGGAREVAKRRNEYYRLIWGRRLGFARLAIRYGCPIVPFASVGMEDCYRIMVDPAELLASPVGKLLLAAGWRRDLVLPLVRGIGPTLWPRPERFYFKFGALIETHRFNGDWRNHDNLWALRRETAQAIESGIVELREYRRSDPDRRLTRRLWRQALGQLAPGVGG